MLVYFRTNGIVGVILMCLSLMACASPPTLDVSEITSQPDKVILAGETASLAIQTTGANIRYKWTTDRGTVSNPNAPAVMYTAPNELGFDVVTVEVTSGNTTTTRSITFNVIEPLPTPTYTPTTTPTYTPTVTPTNIVTRTSTPTATPTTSQTPKPTPTDTLPPPCPFEADNDIDTIFALIHAESLAVNTEDLDIIQAIFAQNTIIFRGDTGESWMNPINRYQQEFEELDFTGVEHFDIQPAGIGISDTIAYLTSGSRGRYTTVDGNFVEFENPNPSDHWILEKISGCWAITRFEFNASHIEFPGNN